MNSTTDHAYTRAELQDPTKRPKITDAGYTVRVTAPRFANIDNDEESRYRVPTPCCGKVTEINQWNVDRILSGRDEYTIIECGKAWSQGRGNSRRGGCRSVYEIRPIVEDGQQHPAVFELTWTGR